jgi:hypothetical protein
MYRIKRFSSLSIKVPDKLKVSEEDYYKVVDDTIINPLDDFAEKISNTGIVSIDKKGRNIKTITNPLKKWHKYKRNKIKNKK